MFCHNNNTHKINYDLENNSITKCNFCSKSISISFKSNKHLISLRCYCVWLCLSDDSIWIISNIIFTIIYFQVFIASTIIYFQSIKLKSFKSLCWNNSIQKIWNQMHLTSKVSKWMLIVLSVKGAVMTQLQSIVGSSGDFKIWAVIFNHFAQFGSIGV